MKNFLNRKKNIKVKNIKNQEKFRDGPKAI